MAVDKLAVKVTDALLPPLTIIWTKVSLVNHNLSDLRARQQPHTSMAEATVRWCASFETKNRTEDQVVLQPLPQELNRECASSYKELNQRVQRSRELRRMAQKMKTQKDLMVGYRQLTSFPPASDPKLESWEGPRVDETSIFSSFIFCSQRRNVPEFLEMVSPPLLTDGGRRERNELSPLSLQNYTTITSSLHHSQ